MRIYNKGIPHMSNRMLLVLIGIVIVGIFLLLAYNFMALAKKHASAQAFLPQNSVEGIAVRHKGLPYTLNFDQQQQALRSLNGASPLNNEVDLKNREAADFDKLIVFLFNGADMELSPVGFLRNEFVYAVPGGSLFITSDTGQFKKMISQTYDP